MEDRTDVLILCCGSRGDTEPWALLAAALRDAGLSVAVAAHAEYETLVRFITSPGDAAPSPGDAAAPPGGATGAPRRAGAPVAFRAVRGSIPRALVETPEGAAFRAAKGSAVMAAAKAFMVPLAELWLEDALAAARELRPRLIVATTMHYIAGAYLIPDLIRRERARGREREPGATAAAAAAAVGPGAGERERPAAGANGVVAADGDVTAWEDDVRFVAAHTVLTHPTGDYAPATGGVGVTLPFAFLNRLFWRISLAVADKLLYRPFMDASARRYGLDPPPPNWYQHDCQAAPPTLYIFSPTLVPPARDWQRSITVTGALRPPPPGGRAAPLAAASAEDAEAAEQLPAGLRVYIADAKRAGRPVVYIGLGSMLGAYYEDPPKILRVLSEGVLEAQRRGTGFAAIIHTVTGARGESADMPPPPAAPVWEGGAPRFVWLSEPVPHGALLPLVDLAVHHGGMGTTHAVAAAGRPAIIVPASVASDQPFWADALRRRGAALASRRPAGDLTAGAFAGLLLRALRALPRLSAAAAELGAALRAEPDGVAAAAAAVRGVLEADGGEAHGGGGGGG